MNFPITENELLLMLQSGEDSFTQFKREVKNVESLAEEFVAFANSSGGYILVGITENDAGKGQIVGVEQLKSLNNHISNASSENCLPQVFPKTQSITINDKTVVIILIEEGAQKPYRTKTSKYLMRSGADKRGVSQEELSRMFQGSGFFHTEELAIRGANFEDKEQAVNETKELIASKLDRLKLSAYIEKQFNGSSLQQLLSNNQQSLEILLNNLVLANKAELNLVGLLFFSKNPSLLRPLFGMKCVSYYGNELSETQYIANDDIGGTLEIQFERSLNFIINNLLKKQPLGQGFNSQGELEVARIALEESIINALVHRDYNKLSPVRIMVFQNRIEIISPGVLPNHLTIDQIKNGNTIARNPILVAYASRLLPYRGLGSGILRTLEAHPKTEYINDKEGQQFKVIFWR